MSVQHDTPLPERHRDFLQALGNLLDTYGVVICVNMPEQGFDYNVCFYRDEDEVVLRTDVSVTAESLRKMLKKTEAQP